MAQRALWKGFLRLSLVTVPVQLFSAVESEHELSLHQVHRPSGERVRYAKTVPGLGEVEPEDIALGYEYEAGQHVLLEDEELREVAPPASDTIALDHCIAADALDPRYVERPFFVVPASKVGDAAYRVLRSALAESGRVGIGEVVLHRRSRPVAVKAHGRGLVLFTLRFPEEVRSSERYFGDIMELPPERQQVRLARELIERQTGPFRPEAYQDDYGAGVRRLIEAKLKGLRPVPAAVPVATAPRTDTLELARALQRSLDGVANRNEVLEALPGRRRA